jgi:putative serine protease PepD
MEDTMNQDGDLEPDLPQPAVTTTPAPPPWHRYDPWSPTPFRHAPAPPPRRPRPQRRTLVATTLAVLLLSGTAGLATGAYLEHENLRATLPETGGDIPARPARSVTDIAAHALPGVVTLHVRGVGEQDTGTGFVFDTHGRILTNNHVVAPGDSDGGEISVTFTDGRTARATVVGRDAHSDLAVVEVENARGLTPLPLGDSDDVRVGDPVVAIGAPFDLPGTVTSGIVSATKRSVTADGEKGEDDDVSYTDALQTDAPINPGNSGGPLLDGRARVIGINSAIRAADGDSGAEEGRSGSIGLGFAIPVNHARQVAGELIAKDRAGGAG